MSKFCPDCGAETNGAKFCPNCGKPIEQMVAGPEQKRPPLHQQQMPLKKRHGCLMPILIFVAICVVIGVVAGSLGGGKGSASKPPAGVNVLLDAQKLSGVTLDELSAQLGEVKENGTIDLVNRTGETVQGMVYDYTDTGTNLVVVDGRVVSLQYWSNDPIPYSDTSDIFAMFGIAPDRAMKKVVDTGSAIRFEAVSGTVSEVWIQSMDSDKKTFDIVKITFDSDYAGRLSTEPERPDLEVLEHSSRNDGYLQYVVGKVKNNTNKAYSYAQVSINLYKGEAQIGSTLANVNNLEPGGIWEFEAVILDSGCDSYKIIEVSGF